ncbi:hypothetical protein Bca101_042410 [Brassica carinata]
MDNMKDLITLQKPIILAGSNFGHWKARMRHLIRGIDEDADNVEDGWSDPLFSWKIKPWVQRPKTNGLTREAASKYNSKATIIIFFAVDPEQFKIIQV